MSSGAQESPAAQESAAAQVDEREARRVAEESREAEWHQMSFAKELFLGRFRPDLLLDHLGSDDGASRAGEAFLARLRTFLAEVDGSVIEREDKIPAQVLQGLAEIGAFGMKIPEEYGGLGLGQVYYNRALMLIATVHPSLGALLSAHQSIGVPEPVRQFGTEEQKRRYLPRCARGEISAFLLTEPDVGSDPARLQLRATPADDGYVLNGTKLWATNGTIADLLVVLARVPEDAERRGGITAFVLEADSPGIEVERRNSFMGLRGLENSLTRFTNVHVPSGNRLGEEGRGLRIALSTLTTGRLAIPAFSLAGSKFAVKIGREWARERVQWGRPVGKHAAIAHKIAFMATNTYAQEAVLEVTGQLADVGRTDIRIEAAMAKLFASERAWQIADELLQVRGGRGFETADSLRARGERAVPAEQMLRDLRINRIFEGSTEIMHLLIARDAVDTHLSVAKDIIDPDAGREEKARAVAGAAAFYARWLPGLYAGEGLLPGSYANYGALATHMRYIERASRRLARSVFYGMARWQAGLEHHQGFLARLVDIGTELFAMTAACLRAQMQYADGSAPRAIRLANAYCRQARLTVRQLFAQLWINTDDLDERTAAEVLDGEHLALETGILDPSEETGPWIAQVNALT